MSSAGFVEVAVYGAGHIVDIQYLIQSKFFRSLPIDERRVGVGAGHIQLPRCSLSMTKGRWVPFAKDSLAWVPQNVITL